METSEIYGQATYFLCSQLEHYVIGVAMECKVNICHLMCLQCVQNVDIRHIINIDNISPGAKEDSHGVHIINV